MSEINSDFIVQMVNVTPDLIDEYFVVKRLHCSRVADVLSSGSRGGPRGPPWTPNLRPQTIF